MVSIALNLFLSGLLFGSGPCIASCGPVLISYIAGTGKNIFSGLTFYILFSSVRILAYLILSLAVFFLGRFVLDRFLGSFSKYVLIIGGIFIIVIGLLVAVGQRLEFHLNSVWLNNFLHFLHKNIIERDKKNMVMLGLVTGFLPCAPLLAILSYIGLVSKTWISSLFYSLSFGLGTLVSPLILLAPLAGLIPRLLVDKKAFYSKVFSLVCGAIIVLLGIQLITKAL